MVNRKGLHCRGTRCMVNTKLSYLRFYFKTIKTPGAAACEWTSLRVDQLCVYGIANPPKSTSPALFCITQHAGEGQ